MTSITLNGERFEVHRSKYAKVENLARYAGRTIYQCYERPSTAKVHIYKEWEEWAYLNDVQYFGVSSYSGFQFSLQGLVEHEGKTYLLSITKSHNYAYIIE